MTAADNKGMQDWVADYKGEGGERAANNMMRHFMLAYQLWKKIEIKLTQKDLLQ
jgi:hypothetical protein